MAAAWILLDALGTVLFTVSLSFSDRLVGMAADSGCVSHVRCEWANLGS